MELNGKTKWDELDRIKGKKIKIKN